MAQTHYQVGRAFEYRIKDFFIKQGYFVMRSPQSKGKVDILAYNKGECIFCQAKLHGAIGVAEWNELLALAEQFGAIPVLAQNENHKLRFYKIIGMASPNERNRLDKKALKIFDDIPPKKRGNKMKDGK
jgi:Holliday junction resolvase